MNNSIKRLQTPLQDVFLRRLSSHFSRPTPPAQANPINGGIAPRLMRGQSQLQREVLNRAQIALIEYNYRSDTGALNAEVGCLNPITGGQGTGVAVTLNIDGTQTTSITAGEIDQVLYTATGTYDIVASAAGYDVTGKRRVVFPELFPKQGVAGT